MKLPASLAVLSRREVGALLALFIVTLPAVTSRLYSSDEIQYYSYLRSLWFDHDVSFDNEYRYFYEHGIAATPGFKETFLQPMTPTGHRENFGTIGCALLWAPFYALADVTTRTVRLAGSEMPADGYSRLYVAAVAYGSAIYGFAALLLSIAAAVRLTGAGSFAGAAVWFGTPLLFYMYAAPPYSHACSAFAVALFVTVWLRAREQWSPRGLIALGAAAALMTMVREQDVFYVFGPAVDYAFAFKRLAGGAPAARARRRSEAPRSGAAERAASGGGAPRALRNADIGRARGSRSPALTWLAASLSGVAAFLVVSSPQLLAYLALNGRLGPSRLVTRKMTWTAPHTLEVLASPQHGLFAWTPLALLAIVGLALLTVKRVRVLGTGDFQRVASCMLLMLILQVYVSGSVESWTVAGAFGQRRFVGATVLLVIGLAALWQRAPRGLPRIATAAVIGLAIWWNIGLMALFGAGLMDRQRLTLRQNAYDVFVTLPGRAPELIYRYFVDRNSFYKTR